MSGRRVALIGCVRRKAPTPQPAHSLYRSDLFRKAFAYAQRHCDVAYVLSAKHGLVEMTEVIAPYDVTLTTMGPAARRCWAERVMRQLGARITIHDEVWFLCGLRYREFLQQWLPNHTRCPIRGLGLGRQLAFYKRALGG